MASKIVQLPVALDGLVDLLGARRAPQRASGPDTPWAEAWRATSAARDMSS